MQKITDAAFMGIEIGACHNGAKRKSRYIATRKSDNIVNDIWECGVIFEGRFVDEAERVLIEDRILIDAETVGDCQIVRFTCLFEQEAYIVSACMAALIDGKGIFKNGMKRDTFLFG